MSWPVSPEMCDHTITHPCSAHLHADHSGPCGSAPRLVCPLSGSSLHHPCFHLGLHPCATPVSLLQTISSQQQTPAYLSHVEKYLCALFPPLGCAKAAARPICLVTPRNHLYSALSTWNGTSRLLPYSRFPRQPCIR